MADFFNILGKAVSGETIGGAADKKIIKKVNPVLTSAERRRITNESTVAAEAFFKVEKRNKKDTFGKTDTKEKKTPFAAAAGMAGAAAKAPKLKFPLLLALGAGITAFAAWIADFIGPVGEFIAKTLPKLLKPLGKFASGFFKTLKKGKLLTVLGKIAGKIGPKILKFGRFIPVIGSLFSFGFGIARWKKGEYGKAILEFLSGILNLLPFGVTNIASLLIDGYLLFSDFQDMGEGEDNKNKIESGEKFSLWSKISGFVLNLPVIKNILSLGKGVGAIFTGDFAAAAQHFSDALPFTPIGYVMGFLADEGKTENLVKGARNVFGKVGDFFGIIVDKFVDIFQGIVSALKNAFDFVVTKGKKLGSALIAGFKALVPGGESPMEAFSRVFGADTEGEESKGFKSAVSEAEKSGRFEIDLGRKTVSKVFDESVAKQLLFTNQLLRKLVEVNVAMAKNGSAENVPPVVINTPQPPNNDMPGSMEGPKYNDARGNFLNSAYTMQPT